MNMEQVVGAANVRTLPVAVPARTVARTGEGGADASAERERAAQAAASRAANEQMRRALADANRQLAQKGSELTFEFNEDAGRVIVRLVDTRTREVLRQIPSEEVLAIARALQDEAAAGALLRTDA